MKNTIVPLLVAAAAFGVPAVSRGAQKSEPHPAQQGSGPSGESPLAYARGSDFFYRLPVSSQARRSASSANIKSADTEVLPEGKGRDLMLEACVQCHDFKVVFSQRKTTDAWRRTVNEMIWRGAPLIHDEAQEIHELSRSIVRN